MVNEQIVFSATLCRSFSLNPTSATWLTTWLPSIQEVMQSPDYKTPSLLDCVTKYMEQEGDAKLALLIRKSVHGLSREASELHDLVAKTKLKKDERPFSHGGQFCTQMNNLIGTVAAISNVVSSYKRSKEDDSKKWQQLHLESKYTQEQVDAPNVNIAAFVQQSCETITLSDLYRLLKKAGHRVPQSTVRGWRTQSGFPAPIGGNRDHTFPRKEVFDWVRTNKGFNNLTRSNDT